MNAPFVVAPNFQCKGSWADRLLVAEADGWRAPNENELAGLTLAAPGDGAACSRLFTVPVHMRTRFWAMLDEEAAQGSGDFSYFSDDLADFLTFKDLPPPKDAVTEISSPYGFSLWSYASAPRRARDRSRGYCASD